MERGVIQNGVLCSAGFAVSHLHCNHSPIICSVLHHNSNSVRNAKHKSKMMCRDLRGGGSVPRN